ncbi:hypothetical protein EIP91_007264 [Steccherinum ochraceum]|uniref:DUF3074 domain-containing protein n=1 Tax=Steccherinum ochraceum TaxID=92696 RepID=A0A4R0R4E0_9APHY|nr:hypothetical protein EIP91_007264 [Steccherinum ochraceum]
MAATKKFQLGITPLKLSNMPPEETILEVGRSVMESSKGWKQGKSFIHGTVRTYARTKAPNESAGWHCRVSEHSKEEATFDEFWRKLGENKAENEKNYVPDIKKVALVKELSPTQSIWTLFYTFPPPISPRVFTVLQTMHLDSNSPRTGLIVSIPIDLSAPEYADLARKEEKGIKGRYTSVERLMELPNGKVEWRMATCSTPGGNIPQFVAEKTMASKISEDVPHFIRWLRVGNPKRRRSLLGHRSASTTSPAAPPAVPPVAKATSTATPAVAPKTAQGPAAPTTPAVKATPAAQENGTSRGPAPDGPQKHPASKALTPAVITTPAQTTAGHGHTETTASHANGHEAAAAEHATNANAQTHSTAVANESAPAVGVAGGFDAGADAGAE